MSSDDEVPAVSPKKKIKIKLNKSPKIKGGDDDVEMKPAAVKSEGAKVATSAKKKRKREPEPDSVKSSTPKKKKAATADSGAKKGLKKLDKSERLQYAMQSFLWWNAKEPPEGCQWVTMEHSGVSFPEPYQPHGIKMLYEGQPIDLTPIQEEA